MPDGNAQIGHNAGPPFNQDQVDKLAQEANDWLDTAGKWLDKKKVETEDDAARLNDFIAGARKKWKVIDEARKDAKKPHDDAGKAVQAAFKPVLEKLERAAQKVQPMLTAFMEEQDRKRREDARKAEEEARKAREDAEKAAAQAAARNDVSGEVDAEEATKAAAAKAKEAERLAKGRTNVSSATGGGRTASLRTYVHAEVKNVRAAFMHFAQAPELLECLRTLAEREARSKDFDTEKDTIPGITLRIERKAV